MTPLIVRFAAVNIGLAMSAVTVLTATIYIIVRKVESKGCRTSPSAKHLDGDGGGGDDDNTTKCRSRCPCGSKPDCERNCFWTSIVFGFIAVIFTIVFAGMAIPAVYPRTYEGASWAATTNTLRQEATRTGMHFGMILRASHDCEDMLSAAESSSVTIENALKWKKLLADPGQSLTEYDYAEADAAVDRVRDFDFRLRGHALVWDSLELTTPKALVTVIDDALEVSATSAAQAARDAMRLHFNTTIPRYADVTTAWDVVNEPIKGSPSAVSGGFEGPLFRALGVEYIDEAFAIAREEVIAAGIPNATLFINEAFSSYDPTNEFNIAFFAMLEGLIARNVPVDCIGIQGHGFYAAPDEALMLSHAQRIVDLGLCVEFTEVDVRLKNFADEADPYAAQGEAIGAYYRTCATLGPENCIGVTIWGVTDRTSWYDAFPPFQVDRPNEPFLHDIYGTRKYGWNEAMTAIAGLPTATGPPAHAVPPKPVPAGVIIDPSPETWSEANSPLTSCTASDDIYLLMAWSPSTAIGIAALGALLLVACILLRVLNVWEPEHFGGEDNQTSPDSGDNDTSPDLEDPKDTGKGQMREIAQ